MLLFGNGPVIPDGIVTVTDEKLNGRLLLTPYVVDVNLTVFYPDGASEIVAMNVQNGTPIVSGEEWFEKMDFITSVCSDSTQCGGYINRWMGAGNPQFERAAV